MSHILVPINAQDLPVEDRPNIRTVRLRPFARLSAAGIAAACLAVLIIATRLSPDASGMNTHTQLGMQPCGFLQATGLPCATCGMTTSYAHFVRGEMMSAIRAQPFGVLAAMATAAGFWVASYAAVTGRPAYRVLKRLPLGWVIGVTMTFWLAGWAWKIFDHVSH